MQEPDDSQKSETNAWRIVVKKRTAAITAIAFAVGLILGAAVLTSLLGQDPVVKVQPAPAIPPPQVVPQRPLPTQRNITQYEPIKTPPQAAPAQEAEEAQPQILNQPDQAEQPEPTPEPAPEPAKPAEPEAAVEPAAPAEHSTSRRTPQEDRPDSAKPGKVKRAMGKIKNAFKSLFHKR